MEHPCRREGVRTREEQIKPWGFISPFAKNSLQDREMCNMTITRKSTVSATMALYTDEQLREAERRAEQRVRAEIGRDSERLDWLSRNFRTCTIYADGTQPFSPNHKLRTLKGRSFRQAIDSAREVG